MHKLDMPTKSKDNIEQQEKKKCPVSQIGCLTMFSWKLDTGWGDTEWKGHWQGVLPLYVS